MIGLLLFCFGLGALDEMQRAQAAALEAQRQQQRQRHWLVRLLYFVMWALFWGLVVLVVLTAWAVWRANGVQP